jgi:signal transduction histidine kinase
MIPPANILIVDDTPLNLDVLGSMLTRHGYKVRPAPSGALALRAAQSKPPDLILLDILMPDMDGYSVCQELKQDEITRDIPVIFISALDDALDKVRAFQVGGVDYITKPFQLEEVLARIQNHLALDRLRKEVEELSTLKDQVIRTVSHDLVVPLDIVRFCTQAAMSCAAVQADPEALSNLQMAQETATQMHGLVTSLLDLSRIEAGLQLDLRAISLPSLLTEQIKHHSIAAEQQTLSLQLILPPEVTLIVDPRRIRQVLSNLLTNAIKYTPAGGTITLAADVKPTEVIIRVEDTGLGIPPEDLTRIFEKFHRVDTTQHMAIKGTGLGLSIVKAIVEQHGGRIWVASHLGAGSCFYVALPLDQKASARMGD